MSNLPQIKALVFALKGGSPGTEIVFLNQNLAILPASIVRRFHAHLLSAFAHRLLDFVDEPRDRPRLVKFRGPSTLIVDHSVGAQLPHRALTGSRTVR